MQYFLTMGSQTLQYEEFPTNRFQTTTAGITRVRAWLLLLTMVTSFRAPGYRFQSAAKAFPQRPHLKRDVGPSEQNRRQKFFNSWGS